MRQGTTPDFEGQRYLQIAFHDFLYSLKFPQRFDFNAMPGKWRQIHRHLSIQAEISEYTYRREHLDLIVQLIKKPGMFG